MELVLNCEINVVPILYTFSEEFQKKECDINTDIYRKEKLSFW